MLQQFGNLGATIRDVITRINNTHGSAVTHCSNLCPIYWLSISGQDPSLGDQFLLVIYQMSGNTSHYWSCVFFPQCNIHLSYIYLGILNNYQ